MIDTGEVQRPRGRRVFRTSGPAGEVITVTTRRRGLSWVGKAVATVAAAAASVALGACSDYASPQAGQEQITLPNPAAQFCTEEGGQYDIREGDKGMVGVCVMPDGTEYDAWSLYRESRALK